MSSRPRLVEITHGAYAAGQNAAVAFGALLFLVELYTLLKRPRAQK